MTGMFSSSSSMLTALWVALGSRATFEVRSYQGLLCVLLVHTSHGFAVLPQPIINPALKLTFQRVRSATPDLRLASQAGQPQPLRRASERISFSEITPMGAPDLETLGSRVTQLGCEKSTQLNLVVVRPSKSWTQDPQRPWNVSMIFDGMPHEPRLIHARV